MVCVYFYGIVGIGVAILIYAIYSFILEERTQRKCERWRKTERDLVILHGYPRGKNINISDSPFIFKVETYLRLTGIKYEYDSKDILGPKGKTPWISLNGKHLGDSELILEHLNKKFEKDLNMNCNEENLANAQIIRVMLEEIFMGEMTNKKGDDQGVGRHGQEKVTHLMTKYIKCVSVSLGRKKYFGGDELCQEDCGIFGVLAQFLWKASNSPYKKIMNDECINLKEYCVRMKERVWQHWENNLIEI